MDDFGGTDKKAMIDRDGEEVCLKALAALPFKDPILYVRIDLMRDDDGKWVCSYGTNNNARKERMVYKVKRSSF